jgi:hypothetical protein
MLAICISGIAVATSLVLELLLRWLDRRFEVADRKFAEQRHKDLIAYHERLLLVAAIERQKAEGRRHLDFPVPASKKGQSHERLD